MSTNTLSQDAMKEMVGAFAASLIENNTIVGLGTGSTARYFIDHLIERCKNGLQIQAISSSKRSEQRAREGCISLLPSETVEEIDVTIDGADEVDPEMRIIKGGGGAHLREKILANASKKYIVIIDEGKLVKKLGQNIVPIELVPFGISLTLNLIKKMGLKGKLRLEPSGKPFLTDNQNYLFDIHQEGGFDNPEEIDRKLLYIPGVIETGFFFTQADLILVGKRDGQIKQLKRGEGW